MSATFPAATERSSDRTYVFAIAIGIQHADPICNEKIPIFQPMKDGPHFHLQLLAIMINSIQHTAPQAPLAEHQIAYHAAVPHLWRPLIMHLPFPANRRCQAACLVFKHIAPVTQASQVIT